jgi:muramoyltetrapeptide carboxypeptidase
MPRVDRTIKIGVVAPASRIEPALARAVVALAEALPNGSRPELHFHPQCFLSSGHFAGDDESRARAFIEVANDESFDALWFARGGYGSCRLAERVLPRLNAAARRKTYLGYSDTGFLLAALYKAGFTRVAHGPMAADVGRDGGAEPVGRALAFLVAGAAEAVEATVSPATPSAAFNITVLGHLVGTPLEPDLAGHVLMLEEVSEPMYRIDRGLFQITSHPAMRRLAGIRLGRCSRIKANTPDFGMSEEEVVRHWCAVSGIPYLGRADIGHDTGNRVVPFGRWTPGAAASERVRAAS